MKLPRVWAAAALLALCPAAAWIAPAHGFDGVEVAAVQRLADSGDPAAQSKLGVLYASGLGVPMDKKQAAAWYARAARQGYPLGQWNLAFMYLRGEGVPEDYARARELLQDAAEKGLVNAQHDLGMLHLLGVGVPADREAGEKWLRLAADRGYPEAIKMLKELGTAEGPTILP